MQGFLNRLETLEDSARNSGYTTAEIITALRKIYFDESAGQLNYAGSAISGGTWDVLIPDASISAPIHWASLSVEREYLLVNKVVRVAGAPIDMARVFCGLDARNHPAPVSLAHGIKLNSNIDALTYLGDLGGVVVEYLHASSRSFEEIAGHKDMRELASFYDKHLVNDASMAGNADAYAIRFLPGDTVHSAFTRYYLNGAYTGRFHELRQVVQTGQGDAHRRLTRQVFYAAMAYAAAKPKYLQDVVEINRQVGFGSRVMLFDCNHPKASIAEAYHNVVSWVVELFLKRISSKEF